MKKVQIGGHRSGSLKHFSVVDDCDFKKVSGFKWCLNNVGYAVTRGSNNQGGKLIIQHRLMFDHIPKNMYVDHINGNKLDNRRSNLRLATKKQNGFNRGKNKNNTSGYKGVYRFRNRWLAAIKNNYKRIHIGCFDTKEEAAVAYDSYAKSLFGEFACLNFKLA